MKLAEALIMRADTQKRIAQLNARLTRYARVQEGDAPAEDPQTLLAEYRKTAREFTGLVQRINRTNAQTAYAPGVTMTDVLAERDALKMEHAMLNAVVAEAASLTQEWRYGRSEIKYRATVDVQDLQAQMDDIARRLRELDMSIQQLNWQVDVVE